MHAEAGGPLVANTAETLSALAKAGLADPAAVKALGHAFTLQQDVSQVLKVVLEDRVDPTGEPAAFRRLLARAGGSRDFRGLTAKIRRARAEALAAYEAVIPR